MSSISGASLRRTNSAPRLREPSTSPLKRAASDPDVLEFGVRNGRGVSNRATILPQLWQRLGHAGPPKIAVVFVEPFADRNLRFGDFRSDSTNNPFGHAAVAYPVDGKLTVMNVVGCAKPALVNPIPLDEYLFSTTNWNDGAEQSGVYNRTYRIFGMWNVDDAKIARMDAFFNQLQEDASQGKAVYNMNLPTLLNWLRKWICGWLPRYGNCASFTGDALVQAGLIKKSSMWPKEVLMSAWKQNRDRRTGTKLVTFEKAADSPLAYGRGSLKSSLISPSFSLRTWWGNLWHRDLTTQCDAVVAVPRGRTEAVLQINRPDRYPEIPSVEILGEMQ